MNGRADHYAAIRIIAEDRLCSYGAYTARAEQLRDGDQQVDDEDEEFAHGANGTITTSWCKAALGRRIASHYEFASHRDCTAH